MAFALYMAVQFQKAAQYHPAAAILNMMSYNYVELIQVDMALTVTLMYWMKLFEQYELYCLLHL